MRPTLPGFVTDRFSVNDQISEKWDSQAIHVRSSWNKLEQVIKIKRKPLVFSGLLRCPDWTLFEPLDELSVAGMLVCRESFCKMPISEQREHRKNHDAIPLVFR